ncbi:DEAD/DEAH box helicase [Clostridium folliculivorans]|uniref:ATP-dependent helicase YprA n=1 Tax=Clostridium folliculivorans TaxID=2886038 RepID=A0A9W5XZC9_9CLOT|nr:DEAD/DEAH box helicase [Clostridium folliculivorans]GKU23705.1 putative ATP-dependent helicase YprA [Clostridium folliculivorans]GKU29821.1 putative ATP-dependent helicase YprA [Clostridium folliculivorans]
MNIDDLIIYNKTIPKREAKYADFPSNLSQELCGYLSEKGIDKLYCHQAEMFEKSMERNNIVITTSTASGKTLSFLLPVINEILSNPLARAVFIYPTKALASDQYRAILPYLEYFGDNRISAGVYDGDTTVNERSRIRKNANIILTNPEMINAAFLPNHSKFGFDFIFSNLKYVVIDELHTYRGAFGSHVANVFRRLGRICRYYNSSPQYLCSSATIANPVELAEEICGQKFIRVDKDGSPAAKRKYMLVQPPKIMGNDKKYYGQVQTTTVAADLIPDLVENDNSFIAFAKSRRNVEVVLKESRDKLETENFFGASLADKISGYRGGYTPLERKEIENKMITGVLRGLISTNALELGIDIGKIDTTVIVGYPGTRASFWQQTGRAGRSGSECTNYLILDGLPFDQYIGVNPDWLFKSGSENAVIDKNNLLIELAHIRAAAAEIPLTLDDISIFPDLGETIPVLIRAKELINQSGKFAWSGNSFPAGDFSLRNIDKFRYKLINKENNKEVTEMDEMQAFREIHNGAIYMHDGIQYQVIKLDLESKTAFCIPFNGNYYTMPGANTDIRIIQGNKEMEYSRVKVAFGDVNVNEVVYMYKKLQFHNHQNLGFEHLEKPLSKDFDTESTWIRIPDNVVMVYRRLLQESQNGMIIRNNHFEGLCYAVKNAAMMSTMTEQEDMGVVMSNNAIEISENFNDEVYMFVYDKYIGGLGYAEKVFDLTAQIVEAAIKMVGGCKCEGGCAACIGDYKLDKAMVLWGLKNLLEEIEAPKGIKLIEYAPSTFIKKQFQFNELKEKWQEFCEYMQENGDSFAKFLSTITEVEIDNRTLTLVLQNAFYKEWAMEETNRKSIINIISFHTDAPSGLQLKVRLEDTADDRKNVKNKLQRRYEDLVE